MNTHFGNEEDNYNGNVSLEEFYRLLHSNSGIVVFKFGASWCSPCQRIAPYIKKWKQHIHSTSPYIRIINVDVDESFELYGHLKTKKMVHGIPALLAYKSGNESFAVDWCVSGTKVSEIDVFFMSLGVPPLYRL